MKRIYTFLLITFLYLLNISGLSSQTPLYFGIISHNEVTDTFDYQNSLFDYNLVKNIVKKLCDTVISKEAKYDLQVDANFIFGCLKYQNAHTATDDLLEWANNSNYIDVDPHNHFSAFSNPYNYSDLAYLLDSCGVTLSRNILGGVTYADTTIGSTVLQENWTEYLLPKQGYTFTQYTWQAEIVWGTATPGHIADYTKFGVWKPLGGSSPSEFGTHNPSGSITHIGSGCKEDASFILEQNNKTSHTTQEIIDNIKQVADNIQNIPSSSNDFYTMNMLVNFRDMPNIPSFVDSISAIIEGIQSYVDDGKIVWATIAEKYNLWYSTHTNPNDFFKYDCEDVAMDIETTKEPLNNINIYPNPFIDKVTVDFAENENVTLKMYDVHGKVVYNQTNINYSPYELKINLPSGIYLLELTCKDGVFNTYVVRQ